MATNPSELFGAGDGLTKVANVFVETVGKEMNAAALQALIFLQQNGSGDMAAAILANKRYMASAGDLSAFLDKLSPAQHAKDMIETQARISADRARGI